MVPLPIIQTGPTVNTVRPRHISSSSGTPSSNDDLRLITAPDGRWPASSCRESKAIPSTVTNKSPAVQGRVGSPIPGPSMLPGESSGPHLPRKVTPASADASVRSVQSTVSARSAGSPTTNLREYLDHSVLGDSLASINLPGPVANYDPGGDETGVYER